MILYYLLLKDQSNILQLFLSHVIYDLYLVSESKFL